MTQYLNSKFSVYAPGTDAYRSNWDRIFASDNMKLDRAIVERVELNYREHGTIVFWPDMFADIGSETDIMLAFSRLACTGNFYISFELRCEDGHSVYCSTEFPTRNYQCPVCDAFVDLEDDLSFVLKTRLVYKPPGQVAQR